MTISRATLQQQIATQRSSINHGLATGKLTQPEAKGLTAKLDQLQRKLDADAFAGGTQFRDMAHAVGGLGKELKAKLTNGASDLQKRFAALSGSIDRNFAMGRLTRTEANALKSELNTAQQKLEGASLGGVSSGEHQALEAIATGLEHKVSGSVTNGNFDGAKRLASFASRLAAGVENGTITAAEAKSLNAQLTEVANQLNGAKLDQTLDGAERNGLGAQFNAIEHALRKSITNGDVNVVKRLQHEDKRLDGLVQSGKLTPEQAAQFGGEMLSAAMGYRGAAMGSRLNAIAASIGTAVKQGVATPASTGTVPPMPSAAGLDLKNPTVFASYQSKMEAFAKAFAAAQRQPLEPVARDANGKVSIPVQPSPEGLNLKDPNTQLTFGRALARYNQAVATALQEGQPVPRSEAGLIAVPPEPSANGLNLKDPNVMARYQEDLMFHKQMYALAKMQTGDLSVARDAAGKAIVPPMPSPLGLNLKDPNERLAFARACEHYKVSVAAARAEGQTIPESPTNPIAVPPMPSPNGLNLTDPNVAARYAQEADFANEMFQLARQQPDGYQVRRDAAGKVVVPPMPSAQGLNLQDPNVQLQFERNMARYDLAVSTARREGQAV